MHVTTTNFKSATAAADFTQSLKDTGFGVITNHPIDMALVDKVYQDWAQFFASEQKNDYLFDRVKQDGFFPSSVSEKAKGYDVKDIKEYYHIYPWGRYPSMISPATRKLYDELSALAATLLTWIEANTPSEIAKKFSMPLSRMITDSPNTLFRILHYPALSGNEEVGAIRAADHEDINLITLLPAATEPGLQVKDSKGNWYDVECDPGSIVVNVGDMLQEASDYYFKSTTHRVKNPEGDAAKQPRYSLPLFLHPLSEVQLSSRYTAESYLHERLRELGVMD